MKNKPDLRGSYSVLLGKFIRELCDRAHFSERDLADELGRRPNFIDELIQGKGSLEFVEFIEIAGLLRLDPQEAVREFQQRLRDAERQ